MDAMERDLRGLRDRALFYFAWATGGRRISEIADLHVNELSLDRFASEGAIDVRLRGTKTTDAGNTPCCCGAPAHI